jgi:O-antigen/teichoic acid export membrane protein
MAVNAAAALVVVAVARLLTSQAYGELAQLLGLFFILSMPGSAVLVGVVRRVTGLQTTGRSHLVRRWVARVHRICLMGLVVELAVVLALQGWIARQLHLPDGTGVVLILMAAGVWILLCVDRGLLQAHRSYGGLATNLLVEGGVRTVLVVVLVATGAGVAGYALGVLVSEVVATLHAHWLARRAWADPSTSPVVEDGLAGVDAAAPQDLLARRKLLADVSAAFVGLALLGLLQNVDVILLGRLDHAQVGPYAAISVASKALVFGAIALGAYLLPEATIRWNEGGHAVRQFGVTLLFLSVPAVVLLGIAVVVPRQFLTLVFSARLSTAAPAFAPLVLAMMCLSFTVLVTNYLFGTGSRWIVLVLASG